MSHSNKTQRLLCILLAVCVIFAVNAPVLLQRTSALFVIDDPPEETDPPEPPVTEPEPPVTEPEPPVTEPEPPVTEPEPPVTEPEPDTYPPVTQYTPPVTQYTPPVTQYSAPEQPVTAAPVPENDALSRAATFQLPHQPERPHLCKTTGACRLSGGRILAGTQDGLLAIIHPDGRVFSLGSIGLGESVHDIVAFPGGRGAIGVASGPKSIGCIFTYDDETGLALHGRIFFQDFNPPGLLGASNDLRLAAVSPDGKYVAIAVGDRLSCVYCFKLGQATNH